MVDEPKKYFWDRQYEKLETEEKRFIRINVTTAIIIIATIIIISIIITAYSLTIFYKANIEELQKIVKLNEAINRLENRNDELITDITNKDNESVSSANE